MRAAELAALYLVLGLGLAAAAVLRARTAGWLDAGLLFLFWPLYGPFLLAAPRPAAAAAPLALGEGMAQRLAGLERRVAEIDGVLTQPDFHLGEAEARRVRLLEAGDTAAAARVAGRIESIRRLAGVRADLLRGLAEAQELMAQLRVQQEVMRMTGGSSDEVRGLLLELESRVEALDELL
jgi:hypothetical protein